MLVLNVPRGRPTTAPEMVDYLIGMALKNNASDIHISINNSTDLKSPYLLRFRVHGRLVPLKSEFIGNSYKEVISRIKILAGLDTTDARSPQDGQIDVEAPEGQVILRVSTVPGLSEGEDIVIRVQRPGQTKYSLDLIRMEPEQRQRLERAIHQRSGLIVLNGPAGSGKTTTIYSIIGALSSPEKKIITAEDPVEARLPYVSHNQVGPKASFADLCRAFMRQDADLIFVGEVRDSESADAAVRLAQTGHLVITSLHTRDSVGVIARLEALQIDSNMVAGTLVASLSQRLIPVLCTSCRVPYRPDMGLIKSMNAQLPVPANAQFFMAGPGCPSCQEGFTGRTPVFELLIVDSEISDLINRKASRSEIMAAAIRGGTRTLAQDVLNKVYAGLFEVRAAMGWTTSDAPTVSMPKVQASSAQLQSPTQMIGSAQGPVAGHPQPAPVSAVSNASRPAAVVVPVKPRPSGT